MANKIYLFSYDTENAVTKASVEAIMDDLYDVLNIFNKNVYLIKTEDDLRILDKYIQTYLKNDDRYILVDITEQPLNFNNLNATDPNYWFYNI
ncbi:hypothetical protein NDK25_20770 [Niallia taxi]|uniref:hypothetical protein n=1 Tax=Niallia taxi TaxID=2499688 RepID=UPI0021A69569|nr:hypothetical protein [Niallia taxi]MCT2345826.1 hypothetical protein [Niallia taxi]MDE5054651.1 hypothetical protein [Niallia taxi]MED3962626.1 hypothetical protein [Niallia taxi]